MQAQLAAEAAKVSALTNDNKEQVEETESLKQRLSLQEAQISSLSQETALQEKVTRAEASSTDLQRYCFLALA